jgi:hypothetical protein
MELAGGVWFRESSDIRHIRVVKVQGEAATDVMVGKEEIALDRHLK